jgi:uroporphyrinogen decarboxylase
MTEHLFTSACRGLPVPRTPVWMMRQAGRYMPEYQAVRKNRSFLDLCKTPELACEVTLQPIDKFGFDAAILFSDILVPLEAMGMELRFTEEGPELPQPVKTGADVDKLAIPDPAAAMPFVLEAVKRIRRALADRVPLIGFAGAPFTMMTYAVEGGGSKNFARTKGLLYAEPAVGHRLLDKLAKTTARYLEAQVESGAQAVQLFDSWAGILTPRDFRELALRYASQVFAELRASKTFSRAPVPIIYFVNGCAPYLDDLKNTGADVLGIDWRIDLGEVRRRVGTRIPVQGNLDPTALFLPPEALKERIAEVLRAAGPEPGHIFNLGHGILPMTQVDRVKLAVDTVRELSSKK